MTVEETAWLAGILEGEGYFGACKRSRGGRAHCELKVDMTDRDIIERVQAMIGGSITSAIDGRHDHYKEQYRARVYGKTATDVMRLVLPYMGERRAQKINEILAMEERKELSHT